MQETEWLASFEESAGLQKKEVTSFKEAKKYIVGLLKGTADHLTDIPENQLEWTGYLELQRKLLRSKRAGDQEWEYLVEALAAIIETPNKGKRVIAQVIELAARCRILEVEPNINKAKESMSSVSHDPLKSAFERYSAFLALKNSTPN